MSDELDQVRRLHRLADLGEGAGHPFHGNQYSSVQVDITSDTFRQKKADLEKAGIAVKVISQNGPSGHPEVQLTGDPTKIKNWLSNNGYRKGDFTSVDPGAGKSTFGPRQQAEINADRVKNARTEIKSVLGNTRKLNIDAVNKLDRDTLKKLSHQYEQIAKHGESNAERLSASATRTMIESRLREIKPQREKRGGDTGSESVITRGPNKMPGLRDDL